jgi:hypothetical protein
MVYFRVRLDMQALTDEARPGSVDGPVSDEAAYAPGCWMSKLLLDPSSCLVYYAGRVR